MSLDLILHNFIDLGFNTKYLLLVNYVILFIKLYFILHIIKILK
jgi:hypothetical protein